MQFIVFLIAIIAGLEQGVTGFGSGIVLMMFLPQIYAVNIAAGVSTSICLLLNLSMCLTYRKHVDLKKAIIPALLYIPICSGSIYFATMVNAALMKKIFGVFFIILSIYYIFFNKGGRKKLSLPVVFMCILISATCDGLFGVGGPLMVVYFLSQIEDNQEYLGTISTFFFINCVYNTVFRVANGIIGMEHLPMILFGIVGIILGGQLSRKVISLLDPLTVRKITYVVIGLAGIINLL